MRKTLKTLLISVFSVFAFSYVNAATVIIDNQGDTFIRPQMVERNLLINSNEGGEFDIAVRPLDPYMESVDGNYKIPLEYVYINNNREDVYLRYNQYSNLLKNTEMNGVSKQLVAKVKGYGMIPAGVYNLNLEVESRDSDTQKVDGTSIFNLQFVVRTFQELNYNGEDPKINVGADEAFNINTKITTDTVPMIYVNSNCDWVLSLNTDRFGEGAGNYYIRTVAASPMVRERLQEKVLITPGKEIIIAKGKAPSDNQYVSLEFSLESKDGEILRAGDYVNNARFILREDK